MLAEALVTLARFNAAQCGLAQHALIHTEERDGPAWSGEWLVVPQMAVATAAGLSHMIELARTLEPNAAAMAANMEIGEGAIHAEALAFALARHMPLSEAQAIVKEAIAYVHAHSDDLSAVQKAFQNDSRFIDRDKGLHIFAHFYDAAKKEAICFGQGMRPKLVGKNMWHLRTPNGRLIVQEIVTMIERDGKGWMEYYWLNPYTKKLQIKISYLEGIVMKDGRKGWVGCGFWKEYRAR